MKKNLTTLFAALTALALLAAACGGDDASASDQEVIDAVIAQISEDGDVPPGVDVDCTAAAMVNGLGGAEVMEAEYGLTAETIAAGESPDEIELAVDDARSMADGMLDCGFADLMVEAMVGDGLEDDVASCLLDSMDQDAIRDTVAAGFMSSADADRIGEAAESTMGASILAAVSECDLSLEDLG